jgi:hypothetical protein
MPLASLSLLLLLLVLLELLLPAWRRLAMPTAGC